VGLWKSGCGLAGLLGLVVLVHRALVFSPRVPFRLDALRLGLPERVFMTSEFASGRFPLWSPYEAFGAPFFAQLAPGVLHPLSLLYAVLPVGRAFAWNYVLSSFLAAVGVWVVTRGRGGSRWAAFIAGAAYGLSGPLVTQSNLTYLMANATLPWAVAGLDGFQRARTPGTLLLAALGVGLVFCAGDPQGVMVAFAFGVAAAFASPAGQRLRALFALVGAASMSAVVAAVQLLPSAEAFALSSRGSMEGATQFSLQPMRLFELFSPVLFSLDAEYLGLLGQHSQPWTPSVFVGGGVLVLAARGALVDRQTRALWLLALLFSWASLGPAFGLTTVLDAVVPVWRYFEYSEKLVPFAVLALSLLAGHGVDEVLREAPGPSLFRVALVSSAAVVGLAVLGRLWCDDALLDFSDHALRSTLVGAFPVAVVGLASASARRSRQATAAVLGLAVAGPPTWFNAMSHLTADEEAALWVPWVAARSRQAHPGPDPARLLPRWDPATDPGTAFRENHQSKALGQTAFNLQAGLDSADVPYHPFVPKGFTALMYPGGPTGAADARVSRVFATGFLSVLGGSVDGEARLAPTWEVLDRHPSTELGITLFRTARRLPKVFVAPAVEAVPDQDTAIARVRDPGFVPGRSVLLECPVAAEDTVRSDRGQAALVTWSPTEVGLQVTLAKAGYVVLNDTWYPGWEAHSDGEPLTICRANGYVRAVRVEAGTHRVVFHYAPLSFTVGVWLSALASVALLLLELRRLRRSQCQDGARSETSLADQAR